MRALAYAIAISSLAVICGGQAGAVPMAPIESAAMASDWTLVRDGCGRGFRYSYRRQACVPDYDREFRGPPVVYVPPPRVYVPPPRVVVPGCPPGQRWSNSRQACVWR